MAEMISWEQVDKETIKKVISTSEVKEEIFNKTELLRLKLALLDENEKIKKAEKDAISNYQSQVNANIARIVEIDGLLAKIV